MHCVRPCQQRRLKITLQKALNCLCQQCFRPRYLTLVTLILCLIFKDASNALIFIHRWSLNIMSKVMKIRRNDLKKNTRMEITTTPKKITCKVIRKWTHSSWTISWAISLGSSNYKWWCRNLKQSNEETWDSAVVKQSYTFILFLCCIYVYIEWEKLAARKGNPAYISPMIMLRLYANNKYTIISKLGNK